MNPQETLHLLSNISLQHKASQDSIVSFISLAKGLKPGIWDALIAAMGDYITNNNIDINWQLWLPEEVDLASEAERLLNSIDKTDFDAIDIKWMEFETTYLLDLISIKTNKFSAFLKTKYNALLAILDLKKVFIIETAHAWAHDQANQLQAQLGNPNSTNHWAQVNPVNTWWDSAFNAILGKTLPHTPDWGNTTNTMTPVNTWWDSAFNLLLGKTLTHTPTWAGTATAVGTWATPMIQYAWASTTKPPRVYVDPNDPITPEEVDSVAVIWNLIKDNDSQLDWSPPNLDLKFLDYDWANWKSTVKQRIEEALTLSPEEIVKKIQWLWVPFDTTSEDWDEYFKNNKIEKKDQEKFKKNFSALYKWSDYWSLWSDGGDVLDTQATFILEQDTKPYVIDMGLYWPNKKPLSFDTKEKALVYLYMHKLLAKEVWSLIQSAWRDVQTVWGAIWDIWEYGYDNFDSLVQAAVYLLGANTSLALLTNLGRWTRDWWINSIKQKWPRYIDMAKVASVNFWPDNKPTNLDPSFQDEFNEANRRTELEAKMKEIFSGNNKKLAQIRSVVESNQKVWTNSYYIKMYQILHWKNAYYRNSQKSILIRKEQVITEAEQVLERKKKAISKFVTPDWNPTRLAGQLMSYMKLSHDVPNNSNVPNWTEAERTRSIIALLEKFGSWDIPIEYLIDEHTVRQDRIRSWEAIELSMLRDLANLARWTTGVKYTLAQITQYAAEWLTLQDIDIVKNMHLKEPARYNALIEIKARINPNYDAALVKTHVSWFLNSVSAWSDNIIDVNATLLEIINNQTDPIEADRRVRSVTFSAQQMVDLRNSEALILERNNVAKSYLALVDAMNPLQKAAEFDALRQLKIIEGNTTQGLSLHEDLKDITIPKNGNSVWLLDILRTTTTPPAQPTIAPTNRATGWAWWGQANPAQTTWPNPRQNRVNVSTGTPNVGGLVSAWTHAQNVGAANGIVRGVPLAAVSVTPTTVTTNQVSVNPARRWTGPSVSFQSNTTPAGNWSWAPKVPVTPSISSSVTNTVWFDDFEVREQKNLEARALAFAAQEYASSNPNKVWVIETAITNTFTDASSSDHLNKLETELNKVDIDINDVKNTPINNFETSKVRLSTNELKSINKSIRLRGLKAAMLKKFTANKTAFEVAFESIKEVAKKWTR